MKLILFDVSRIISDSILLKIHMNMKNRNDGEPIGGSLEFLTIIRDSLNKFPDYYPIVCWDGGLSNWRREIDRDYKSYNKFYSESRALSEDSDAPERANYLRQKSIIEDILSIAEIYQIAISGLEREDLLSFISEDNDNEYIIVSDDDDLAQLLKDNVSIYRPFEDTHVLFDSYKINLELNDLDELATTKGVVGDYLDMVKGCCKGVGDVYANSLLKLVKLLDDHTYHSVEFIKKVCEENNIPYRSAYINFDRAKFIANYNLYKLRPCNHIEPSNEYLIKSIISTIKEDRYDIKKLEEAIDNTDYIDLDRYNNYHITYRYSC